MADNTVTRTTLAGDVTDVGAVTRITSDGNISDARSQLSVEPDGNLSSGGNLTGNTTGNLSGNTTGNTTGNVTKEPPKDGTATTAADDPRLTPFTQEFTETGALSAESITKAAKEFNVSEAVVKAYIAGQTALGGTMTAEVKAVQEAQVNAAYEGVGGKDNWQPFVTWANTNLPPDDLAILADAANGASPAIAKAITAQMYAKFQASGMGGAPRDVSTQAQGGNGPGAVQGFASLSEQTAALRDKRYRDDASYRAVVDQRIGATRFR